MKKLIHEWKEKRFMKKVARHMRYCKKKIEELDAFEAGLYAHMGLKQ